MTLRTRIATLAAAAVLLLPVLPGAQAQQAPAKIGYMTTPTPGQPNVSNVDVRSGFVTDTQFSIDRGFYDQPIEVEITTNTPDAEIRYTTDGTAPTATHGQVYSGPVAISTTTTLRAGAFKDDFIPTNTDTHTYLYGVGRIASDRSHR